MSNTISINVMPIDDIKEQLQAKGVAVKTDTVANADALGGVDANGYALCVNDDQHAVQRAMSVFSAKDDCYKDADEIVQSQVEYAKEIKNMKDELYQLQNLLMKNGTVNYNHLYSGFTDPFIRSNPLYVDTIYFPIVSITNSEITLSVDASEFVGDTIIIEDGLSGNQYTVRITDVLKNSAKDSFILRYEMLSPVKIPGDIIVENIIVRKTKGEYNSGTFSFSKMMLNASGDRDRYSVLDDDRNVDSYTIDQKDTGLAYTFTISNYLQGFVSKILVKGIRYGTPGKLKCVIIKESDMDVFHNPIDSEHLVIASSEVEFNDKLENKVVEFDFLSNNQLALLEQGRYCALFYVDNATKDSCYNLTILTSDKGNDLQTNNCLYAYRKLDNSLANNESAFTPGVRDGKFDLYFGIATRELIADGKEDGYQDGLYTTKVELYQPTPISSVRATMVVNREGKYSLSLSDLEEKYDSDGEFIYSTFKIERESDISENVTGKYNMSNGEQIVVGNTPCNILKYLESAPNDLTVDKKITPYRIIEPVYRIGYQLRVKAKRADTGALEYYPLTLSNVVPVFDDRKFSDRLIFTADFSTSSTNRANMYSWYELQIVWNSVTDTTSTKDFIGRIKQLVVSTDSTV